ncbi:hypothetical protein HK104_005392 [Borealophlyctis nickersoniae]|nr:hypothetical protein HK104_005392 [Borealophlyctis nickersoniae]
MASPHGTRIHLNAATSKPRHPHRAQWRPRTATIDAQDTALPSAHTSAHLTSATPTHRHPPHTHIDTAPPKLSATSRLSAAKAALRRSVATARHKLSRPLHTTRTPPSSSFSHRTYPHRYLPSPSITPSVPPPPSKRRSPSESEGKATSEEEDEEEEQEGTTGSDTSDGTSDSNSEEEEEEEEDDDDWSNYGVKEEIEVDEDWEPQRRKRARTVDDRKLRRSSDDECVVKRPLHHVESSDDNRDEVPSSGRKRRGYELRGSVRRRRRRGLDDADVDEERGSRGVGDSRVMIAVQNHPDKLNAALLTSDTSSPQNTPKHKLQPYIPPERTVIRPYITLPTSKLNKQFRKTSTTPPTYILTITNYELRDAYDSGKYWSLRGKKEEFMVGGEIEVYEGKAGEVRRCFIEVTGKKWKLELVPGRLYPEVLILAQDSEKPGKSTSWYRACMPNRNYFSARGEHDLSVLRIVWELCNPKLSISAIRTVLKNFISMERDLIERIMSTIDPKLSERFETNVLEKLDDYIPKDNDDMRPEKWLVLIDSVAKVFDAKNIYSRFCDNLDIHPDPERRAGPTPNPNPRKEVDTPDQPDWEYSVHNPLPTISNRYDRFGSLTRRAGDRVEKIKRGEIVAVKSDPEDDTFVEKTGVWYGQVAEFRRSRIVWGIRNEDGSVDDVKPGDISVSLKWFYHAQNTRLSTLWTDQEESGTALELLNYLGRLRQCLLDLSELFFTDDIAGDLQEEPNDEIRRYHPYMPVESIIGIATVHDHWRALPKVVKEDEWKHVWCWARYVTEPNAARGWETGEFRTWKRDEDESAPIPPGITCPRVVCYPPEGGEGCSGLMDMLEVCADGDTVILRGHLFHPRRQFETKKKCGCGCDRVNIPRNEFVRDTRKGSVRMTRQEYYEASAAEMEMEYLAEGKVPKHQKLFHVGNETAQRAFFRYETTDGYSLRRPDPESKFAELFPALEKKYWLPEDDQEWSGFTDTFGGAGLLASGFELAGFEKRWTVECNVLASQANLRNTETLQQCLGHMHNRSPKVHEDINKWCPCCGFSGANFAKTQESDASAYSRALSLVALTFAIVGNFPALLLENVRDISEKRNFRFYLDTIQILLLRFGYQLGVDHFEAPQFGLAAARHRVFLRCSRLRGIIKRPWALYPEPTLENAYGDLKDIGPNGFKKNYRQPLHVCVEGSRWDRRPSRYLKPGKKAKEWPDTGVADEEGKNLRPSDNGRHLQRAPTMNGADGFHPTVTGGINRLCYHPIYDRRETLLEIGRLLGIPESFCLIGKGEDCLRQLGNGVPVPLAEAYAIQIRKAMSYDYKRLTRMVE